MFPRAILMTAATQGGGRDSDLAAWAAAVVANGGTVSAARAAIVAQFIGAEKDAGTWARTDDYWLLCAESSVQALTSLKQRRLATVTDAPTFTTDRGYAFNGTTQYLDTGFIPDTHKVAMATNEARFSTYERTNVAANSYASGIINGTSIRFVCLPRSGTNTIQLAANTNSTNMVGTTTDSRGLTSTSRTAAGVCSFYKNGSFVETYSPPLGSSLPTISLYIGGYNNAGVAAGFRASTLGFASIGASLTAAQELASYNAMQAYMTAIGANV